MDEAIAEQISALNRQFYQNLGEQFSATRKRLQPGVQKLLPTILSCAHILDLGCGNGELARQMIQKGFQGSYIGLDFSLSLLKEAGASEHKTGSYTFRHADLADAGWAQILCEDEMPGYFDCILGFASLHHIPGKQRRVQALKQARQLISSQGRLIHAEWMFLNSPRMRSRIQPWEKISLQASQVDPGDYLLDWKGGGYGLRYVHHFTTAELEALAAETGFRVQQSFLSDGEGNKLSCYQIWEPVG